MAHDRGIKAIHIEKDRFQLIYNTYIHAHNLKYYLKNPYQFLKDYKAALWRIGFLKQVFKVNLPYDKIVSLQKHI